MPKINIRLLSYLTGIVLLIESAFMGLSVLASFFDHFRDLVPMLLSILITFSAGTALFLSLRNRIVKEASVREAFIFVSSIWIIVSLFGTLPYLFSRSIPNFINAYFESVSGFTTTGSSILADIESLSSTILFWRSTTHWMGGMGIILLVIVVLPSLKTGGVHLYAAETTRAAFGQIKPRILDAAKQFGVIYLSLTILEILFLMMGHMTLFDSICHAFGTVATGGFSTKNDSIAGFSPYIQYVIIVFMFLSGINFGIHFLLAQGRIRSAFRNEELKLYSAFILFFTLVIFIILLKDGRGTAVSFRESLFQVVSIITCTGFGTTDYLLWPAAAWVLIFVAMFIGASAGSTGGGIKVIRHLLVAKNLVSNIRALIHPHLIYAVKYQGNILSSNQMRSVIAFYFWYMLIFMLGTLILLSFGTDFYTSIGSMATTLAGIGPGLGETGPASNYFYLHDTAKVMLTFSMIIGRLELYAFLVLFSKAFWRH